MRRRPAAAIEKVRRRSARRRYLRRRLAKPAPDVIRADFEFAVEGASTPKAKEKAPMDMARSEVRKLAAEDYSTTRHLEHASRQARERNYQDFLIVDVDAHHYESESYNEVFHIHRKPGDPPSGGRIGKARRPRLDARRHHRLPGHRRAHHAPRAAQARHPQARQARRREPPRRRHDAGMDERHGRRLFLPVSDANAVPRPASAGRGRSGVVPRIISMLYLPFNDPDAAYKTVKDFGDKKGVVGFMVTSPRYKPVHDNAY